LSGYVPLNAPHCIGASLDFQNFPGEDSLGTPCLSFSIVRGNRTITEAILSLAVEKINREPTVYEIGVLPRKTMFPCLFPTFPAFDLHCRQPFWFITALKCHSVLYTVVPFYYLELDNNFIASD